MAFDPVGFLETGRFLLGQGPVSEATFRTVCGRAYYAAYGTMRHRLCRAKGVTPRNLFGRAGRHGDVIKALNLGSARFKRLGFQYQRLFITRVKSDYNYSTEVTRQEAVRALEDAEWVASRLASIPNRDFKSLPLAPHGPGWRP